MRSLIAFELKKMLGRRVAQVACVGILVMLAGIMALNVVQTKTTNNAGAILSGTEAIAQMRADAEAHAGELTPERIEADMRAFMEMAFSRLSPEDVVDLSDAAAYQLVVETYDGDEFAMILDSYYGYLLAPWDAPGRETYQVAADLVQQAGIIAGVALVFYGADGASLPVQTMSLAIPCDLTMMQAVLTAIGLAYLMTLGFAALTLALSALFRSMLAVFALDVALLFLSGMIPAGGNAVLMHLLYLFPLNALMPQPLFSDLMSYAAGPVVLDLVGMLVFVYAIVAIAAMPAGALTWKRHQVA